MTKAGAKSTPLKRPVRIVIGVLIVLATLGSITCGLTIAVCRVSGNRPDLSLDEGISTFMDRQDYEASDLIVRAEQIVDNRLGLGIQPHGYSWADGTYHCRNHECELQHLLLEIPFETSIPCPLDGNARALGSTLFSFDTSINKVQAFAGWYDRPVEQEMGTQLSEVSPTMDEAVLSTFLQESPLFAQDQTAVVQINARRDHWRIRIDAANGILKIERVVPFNQS